jgi:ribosomal protein L11 methyltransferase
MDPMKWMEVSILTTHEAQEAVSEILHRAGAVGVVIEDSNETEIVHEDRYGEIYALDEADFPEEGIRVKGYFPLESSDPDMILSIRDEVLGLIEFGLDPGAGEILMEERDEEEWANAWKQYYHPVRISERITVCPTWEAYEPGPGEEIIRLDPGMAFGTGTHATTALCLRLLEKHLTKGCDVIDVGCGSGILSIAAAKLGARSVLALDLDPVAIEVSRENVLTNQVAEQVEVRQNDLLQGVMGSYDLIVSNILAEVILMFVGDAYRLLKTNGKFIVSGIIQEKASQAREELVAQGFSILDEWDEQDWKAFAAIKK